MFYTIAGFTLLALSALILILAIRLLLNPHWFWGWMKGMIGLALLFGAAVLGLIAWEFKHYKAWQLDKPLATVSFEEIQPQTFVSTLAVSDVGVAQEYLIKGDQWQMDARILRWKGFWANFGGAPGYRLERVSGRYLSIDDEQHRERTLYSLLDRRYQPFDFWTWLFPYKDLLPVIEMTYGSATFVPMADGALFEVSLTRTGLAAKPLNDAALEAVNQWIK
jgi:hypothetical protein